MFRVLRPSNTFFKYNKRLYQITRCYSGSHKYKDQSQHIRYIDNINNLDNSIVTNKQLIDKDYGLRQFIKKTYLWTGTSICGTLGLSMLGATLYPEFATSFQPLISGFMLSIGSIVGISFSDYSVHKDIITNKFYTNRKVNIYRQPYQIEILYSKNSFMRKLSYSTFILGNSMIIMPVFIMFPQAVFPAFVASTSVFGGATLYALSKKEGELEVWKSGLYSGLSGLVSLSIFGIGSQLIFGQNLFGEMAHLFNLFGGIPLFSGLVAYDTHKSIEKYRLGDPDHLSCSSELYLDFLNLFVRFAEIISQFNSSK